MMITRNFIGVVVLCLCALAACTSSKESKKTLTVLSWNVWHGGHSKTYSGKGCEGTIDILKKSEADVVLMIETYGAAPMVADSLGYSYNLISDNLSIYSRYPIIRKYAFADSISTFNFGCVLPEGYRKALRLIKQAEKFHRPVICFVDTQGANCGKGAEERGQGQAIANNLYELTDVKTPIISVMIGEGGSGGALALAVADEVWMLENAYYSVITPESCASILFKDPKRAPEAAEHLKLTAADLNKMGIVEKVVEEPEDFSEEKETAHFMKKLADDLSKEIKQLEKKPVDKLLDDRYEKYRKIGRYSEYSEAVGEVPGAAQLLGVSQAPARKRRGLFGRG